MGVRSGSKKEQGFSVVEVLIASALVVIAFSSLLGMVSFLLKVANANKTALEAEAVLKSTVEAVRAFRETSEWSVDGLGTMVLGNDYYPEKDLSGEWILSSGRKTAQGITSWVVFYEVRRDANGDIVSSGGNLDPDSLKAVVTVERNDAEKTLTSTFYLTNWLRL